ncbi:MAG: hypothetical protein DCE86_05485 [Flavobacteriaceae bacterium]|nr:MAG: hypothetical protein DCE86_05485 [Flavobacteriaceae bacterium]
MPVLKKQFTLEVTPEQFLDNCSRTELIEIGYLLSSPRFQKKIELPDPAQEYLEFDGLPKYRDIITDLENTQ